MLVNESRATKLAYYLDKMYWFKQYLFKPMHTLTQSTFYKFKNKTFQDHFVCVEALRPSQQLRSC